MKNIVIDIFGPVNDIIILIGVEIKHMPKFRRGTVAYDYLYLGYDRSQTFLDMEMECVIDYFPQGCFMTRVTLPETNSIRSGKAFAITNDRVMTHQNSLVFLQCITLIMLTCILCILKHFSKCSKPSSLTNFETIFLDAWCSHVSFFILRSKLLVYMLMHGIGILDFFQRL